MKNSTSDKYQALVQIPMHRIEEFMKLVNELEGTVQYIGMSDSESVCIPTRGQVQAKVEPNR